MSTSDPLTPSQIRRDRTLRRLLSNVLGADAAGDSDADAGTPSVGLINEAARTARKTQAMAALATHLGRGADLETAVLATVRELIDMGAGEYQSARAVAMGAARTGAPWLSDLCIGLVDHRRMLFASAWSRFAGIDEEVLAARAPFEALTTAFHLGVPEASSLARAVVDGAADHTTPVLAAVAGPLLVSGHRDLAAACLDEVARRTADGEELSEETSEIVGNLRRWTHPTPAPAAPEGAVRVGVIDYYQPDFERSSRNVGDYVQTLAMLGHLARFTDASFTGEQGLGELATELQGRVRPELRAPGPSPKVHLSTVSRDFSEGDQIEPDTWMVAFGWHMHPMFNVRHGLPYHRNINPIFLSFHVNETAALTPEALDYLRANGPIGCRDWTTVYLLLGAGVDAFFTGCVTTTVGNLFPDRDSVRAEPTVVAAIDYPAGKLKTKRPVESSGNIDAAYRSVDLVGGVRHSIDRLDEYQRRYHRIVTSRLHAYLPATSLGVPVAFRPRKIGDVRFDGLLGMSPDGDSFQAMRSGITDLLSDVLGLVLAGAGRDEVHARWRELTAPRVAEARARFSAPAEVAESPVDPDVLVARVSARRRDVGPAPAADATHVSLSCDANLATQLPVTLESIVANASAPLHLWLCTRGLEKDYQDWLAQLFPTTAITFLPFDDVEYGEITRMIEHITVSTMDRLLLPSLLPEVPRITYIDIDTVTEGDVCELADTDLGGHPFAARESYFLLADMWRGAGDLLPADRAAELRRTMSARHPFGSRTLNAGVLVLDLESLRRDGFVEWCLGTVARYGLNDQDVLLAWAGDGYQRLHPRWNSLPVVESIDDWSIVHYAGIGKPWSSELTPHRDHWDVYAHRVAERAQTPPPVVTDELDPRA